MCTKLKKKKSEERKLKNPKWMERYTMFMDWKTHIVKMLILPELIYMFDETSIKITARFFFAEIDKIIQNVHGWPDSSVA